MMPPNSGPVIEPAAITVLYIAEALSLRTGLSLMLSFSSTADMISYIKGTSTNETPTPIKQIPIIINDRLL